MVQALQRLQHVVVRNLHGAIHCGKSFKSEHISEDVVHLHRKRAAAVVGTELADLLQT